MDRERKVRFCAQVAHEANRIYCQSLDDFTQPEWSSAPDWQKTSAIQGVEGVLTGNTAEQSHVSWLKEKQRTGWRWGATKDVEKKEHPCMVPYAALPREQRLKDDLYVETVRAMAKALGLEA